MTKAKPFVRSALAASLRQTAGYCQPDELGGSRPVLGERGGATPPRHSPRVGDVGHRARNRLRLISLAAGREHGEYAMRMVVRLFLSSGGQRTVDGADSARLEGHFFMVSRWDREVNRTGTLLTLRSEDVIGAEVLKDGVRIDTFRGAGRTGHKVVPHAANAHLIASHSTQISGPAGRCAQRHRRATALRTDQFEGNSDCACRPRVGSVPHSTQRQKDHLCFARSVLRSVSC